MIPRDKVVNEELYEHLSIKYDLPKSEISSIIQAQFKFVAMEMKQQKETKLVYIGKFERKNTNDSGKPLGLNESEDSSD